MKKLVLSALFGDYAVLPQGLPIRVYGRCEEAGNVTLTLPDGEIRTADFVPKAGSFCVTLSAVDRYTDDAVLTVSSGEEIYTSHHIAIGIVLLAGGQSNMEFLLKDAVRPLALYPSDKMRFFTEKHVLNEKGEIASKPMSDRWFRADGVSELFFSSIGYFVAERLSRTLSVTVGVVSLNQGASRIESWLSPEAVLRVKAPAPLKPYPDALRPFNLNHWLYYNKYLHVCRYAVSAVLWYQGESNTGFDDGEHYGKYLHELFAEWRANNQNEDLPFYLVELAPFDSVKAGWAPEPLGAWAPVREALVRASLTEKNVYTVSLTENENVAEIHPVNKYPLAEKLSRAILRTCFGGEEEYTGPVLNASSLSDRLLTLTFTHAEGLTLRPTERGEGAEDLYYVLSDGTHIAAEAEIVGETLQTRVPENALSLAMGYHNVPTHNLYNDSGYLASPFFLSIK